MGSVVRGGTGVTRTIKGDGSSAIKRLRLVPIWRVSGACLSEAATTEANATKSAVATERSFIFGWWRRIERTGSGVCSNSRQELAGPEEMRFAADFPPGGGAAAH